MRRVALKGMLGRKLRTILTMLAIVIGVSMVSGTFVLTDTIDRAFTTVFDSSYAETDAVVSGTKLVDWSASGNATVPASLLAKVQSLPDVEEATGSLVDLSGETNTARLVDEEGKVIGGAGSSSYGFGLDGDAERFNPFHLVEGTWATGPNDVVIDSETASGQDLAPGDAIRIAGDGPVRTFRIVGTARFGDLTSLGGATFAIFTVPTAREVLHKQGFDTIAVAAREGVAPEQLVDELQRVVPQNTQVKTGEEQAKADQADTDTAIMFIKAILLAFGGVALFVGAFVIFNTLSITVAQRTREFATIRSLGGSRRQVLRSVLLESFVMGLCASLIGLAAGLGLAKGLSALMSAAGISLPEAPLVFAPRTVVVSLGVGILITVLAGILPAVRATRIPPIAAVREGSLPQGSGRRSQVVGIVLCVIGIALVGIATVGAGSVLMIGVGVLLLFVGVAAVAPRLVPGLVAVVGKPSSMLGGVAGRLAKRNATRSPARTASAAAALMIGLTLVTLFAVVAAGLRGSDRQALEQQLKADYIVQAEDGYSAFTTGAGHAVEESGAVASAVRFDRGRVGTSNVSVNGVDANITRVVDFDWTDGTDAAVTALGKDGAALQRSFASDRKLAVGDPFTLQTASGDSLRLRVAAIYDPPKLDQILDGIVISRSTFDKAFPRPQDRYVFVAGGDRSSLEDVVAGYPGTKVFDRESFIVERSAFVGQFLSMVYVLLALSVVVSLFGMINTLVLSVFERTREIGMMRAVGMSRRQARSMVRNESIITALIGAAIGLPLGLGLAAVVTHLLSDYGVTYQVPIGAISAFVAIAVMAGFAAALLPARRASRLNVLEALQYE
jgi:putative ABC transport system permease protein